MAFPHESIYTINQLDRKVNLDLIKYLQGAGVQFVSRLFGINPSFAGLKPLGFHYV